MSKPQVVAIGKKAPDFSLKNAAGETVSLKQLRGKKVVLYFYPKDDTSGCTKQACAFRDGQKDLKKLDAVVIGVSPDSESSHAKFAAKYDLPFELLSDPEKIVSEAYGVWKEKSMYGKKYMGVERSTFLIDEEGILRAELRKVKVDPHFDEVLGLLDSAFAWKTGKLAEFSAGPGQKLILRHVT